MEQAKSRILAEAVVIEGNPLAGPTRSSGNHQITALRKELNWYYHRLEIEQTRPEGISLPQINISRPKHVPEKTRSSGFSSERLMRVREVVI